MIHLQGRKGSSFRHFGWISLLLKELASAVMVTWWWGVGGLSIRDHSFAIIPLCPTTSTGSWGYPRTELALLTSPVSYRRSSGAPLHSRRPQSPEQRHSALTLLKSENLCSLGFHSSSLLNQSHH
ncbi:unnamed protein product [Pleuronectes platessa]|uniref:Uncharacterized protein n=1 Tax=Pleuronectes platessa TaxID=8262 RepID=A0A9N7TTK0_PLEPL|nr:unnamed protein product [Pleuronectes platessa]